MTPYSESPKPGTSPHRCAAPMDSTIATSATAHQSHTTDARQDTGFWSECPSGSDSDTIDTERIIKSSGWLRSRLERCYREACGAADRDSGQGDVLDLGSLRVDERSDDPQMSCDAEFPDCRLDSRDSMLRWQPRFLEEHVPRATATTDGAAATNTAPHDMEIEEAEQEQEQEQQEQQHFYPLRRRSEKNLHPYTKLVWTNPAELRDARNKRRDLSLLDESQPIYAQDTFVQEESEDEDYVPGLNDPAELESQSIARVYLEPQLMPLLEEEENDDDDDNGDAHTIGPNATDSAISLSARRRVGGRTYRHLATQKKRARKGMRDISAFPSIEELLGAPAPNPIPVAENGDDPFDVPHAQMLQSERVPKTKLYSELSPSSDLDTADILLHGIVDTPSKTAHTLSQPDSPAITDGHTGRRRRLVSRKQPDHLSPTASPELLPTAKARKLDKISRHQIRGVLPFSFLRGFDKKKQSEIEEEVKRWEQQSPGSRSIRRRIRSSSPELQSDRDQNSPTHAEQFDQAPRKLFEFGFLDIYRWQFPELLMTKDGAGKGPDFLRLAARECNRQKNLYSADNPWRKIIKIEPRNSKEAEEEEEDVASSIVAAWRLGVIDIRRVYFCDDEDSDDQEYYENNRYPSDTLDVAGDNMEGNESAILISDDEAIEDNWGFDTVGGQIKTFGNATSRLPKNTKQKSSRSSRSSRSTRPSLLMDDHRPRDSYTLSLPKTQQPSGIRAIMGEFAAFDSDSDTDTRNLTHPLNLPRGSISKHLARKYEESNRRRDFVRRFKQWHRPTNRPIHQPRRSNTSDYPRENSRRPGVAHGEHVSAEYLFDNDPTLDTSQSSKHQQVSRKHKQTRLLLPLSGRGNENMSMDRVIERIGKTTPSRQISLVSKTSVGKQWRASGRSTRRKAMPPTRVQRLWFDSTKSGSSVRCPPSKPLAISGPKPVPALNSGQPFESRSDMLELEESDLLFGIGSGTQFRNDTWIGQGGIQRMRRLLYLDRQDVPEPDYSDTFHYNDVLSISISTATLEEFLQAFSMLCKLWCTKDITSESMAMSIFRWMEFCQRFISRQQYNNYEQNSSGICKVVNGVVGCVHEHLSEASPSVALVLAVSVMQVAREVTVWRSKKPHDAPKDSEDLLDQWTSERLASEIDNCVLVAAGSVLSVQQIDANFGLSLQPTLDLGFHAQCTVVLLHSLESISEYMTSIAPLSAAILCACDSSSYYCRDTKPGVSQKTVSTHLYWRALARLTSLTQINADGVAAPRPANIWHNTMVSVAEAAIKNTLQPNNVGDLAIRQTFVRTSRLIQLDVEVQPNSSLYVLLFRYLESRKFASLNIEPAPSLPRFFTRYTGEIPISSGGSLDTCMTILLRLLDKSFSQWVLHIGDTRFLRKLRTTISKLLPTCLLTITKSDSLQALSNYYSIFLFFLHAVPCTVVRPIRLIQQFQVLLQFQESTNMIARKVYFEAWMAGLNILVYKLRNILQQRDARCMEKILDISDNGIVDNKVDREAGDYFTAIKTSITGWASALEILLIEDTADSWELADAALVYLLRVLQGMAIAEHTPTQLLLVLFVLQTQSIQTLLLQSVGSSTINSNMTGGYRSIVLGRILDILVVWRQSVTRVPKSTTMVKQEVMSPVHFSLSDSQGDFELDANDFMDIAMEAAELERVSMFTPIDEKIIKIVHEAYVPGIRKHIIHYHAQINIKGWHVLDMLVAVLAQMVSICVSAKLRTWEGFLGEYGRDSLYLASDDKVKRRVLVGFTVKSLDIVRGEGLYGLARDVWFTVCCDIGILGFTERLAAQLWWIETSEDTFKEDIQLFSRMREVNRRFVSTEGSLREPICGENIWKDMVRVSGQTDLEFEEYELDRTICLIKDVLSIMHGYSKLPVCSSVTKQVFSLWISRILATMRSIKDASSRVFYGGTLSNGKTLVESMSERILVLVDQYCLEFSVSSNT